MQRSDTFRLCEDAKQMKQSRKLSLSRLLRD